MPPRANTRESSATALRESAATTLVRWFLGLMEHVCVLHPRGLLQRVASVGLLALFPGAQPVQAHGVELPVSENALPWKLDPLALVLLLVTAVWYLTGTERMRGAMPAGVRLRRGEAWCFWAGWWTLAVALLSPVHALGHDSFAVHMVQHELLMIAAAPLLVLGRPMVVVMRAFSAPRARRLADFFRRSGFARGWRWLTLPLVATLVHAAALWLWHIPTWFDASVEHDGIHALQHFSFLGSALLFWESLLFGRQRRAGYGIAVLYVFLTLMHSGLLGAILTFAPRVLYSVYNDGPGRWDLSGLEDQQLGGIIMWVPAGIAYMAVGLALFRAWLLEAERRGARTPGR